MMDELGGVFCDYRKKVYAAGFTGRMDLAVGRAAGLCRTALEFVDRSILANRRDDGLYHTYNLLEIEPDGSAADVIHMKKMLEGQVAVLSSGLLGANEALEILEILFASDLYRESERSFMLYPEWELKGFLEKNIVPADRVKAIPLLAGLIGADNTALLTRDADGVHRFHGDLGKGDHVAAVLDDLARHPDWAEAAARDREEVLDLFEDVFNHQCYTGRSGVMYGYEGIGCIYWHMVAKLLLAVQENVQKAILDGAPDEVRDSLAAMYYRVREGIGYEKTVAEYGAFPVDPYSHTPPSGGAKQPGMTGQVKEEILTRFGELGVAVEGGAIRFRPTLLENGEFLDQPGEFRYFDVDGNPRTLALAAGCLAFTYCQVPVVYERTSGEPRIRLAFDDGSAVDIAGDKLDLEYGTEIHARSGRIEAVRVTVPEGSLAAR